jgi:hypothetical protein
LSGGTAPPARPAVSLSLSQKNILQFGFVTAKLLYPQNVRNLYMLDNSKSSCRLVGAGVNNNLSADNFHKVLVILH